MGGPRKIQFRAEMFNFINHANLNAPNTDITPPQLQLRPDDEQERGHRDMQLSLRFLF